MLIFIHENINHDGLFKQIKHNSKIIGKAVAKTQMSVGLDDPTIRQDNLLAILPARGLTLGDNEQLQSATAFCLKCPHPGNRNATEMSACLSARS